MNGPDKCALCENPDKRDLGTSLAHWLNALPGMAYTHVDRCIDRDKCRARVISQGDVWPLVEVTTYRRTA